MKTLLKLIFIFGLLLIAACSSSGNTRSSGADARQDSVEYPGFLILTADDLNKLDAATRKGAVNSEVMLSEGRKASCAKQACEFLGAKNGVTASLEREHLDEIRYLWNESVSKAKPQIVINGPVTVRCMAERCNADLYYRGLKPIEVREKGKVVQEGDPAGFFLPDFVRAILKSGIGRS